METLQLKTKIIFGKNGIQNAINELKERKIEKIFVNFAGGGLLKTPLYKNIQIALKKAEIEFEIFSNIQANPQTKDIDSALKIMFKLNPQMILSIGGGSTHDSSKVIATCFANGWKNSSDYINGRKISKKPAMLIGAMITTSATSSENNTVSVITDSNTHFKAALFDPTALPSFCVSDPELTFSVSEWHTACGGFDAFCHLIEDYYSKKTFDFTRNIIVGLMKTVISSTIQSIKTPNDYEARGNMMMSTTYSLNSLSKFNNNEGGWNIHWLGHAISGKYDTTHGATLALVMPVYLKWCLKNVEGYEERTKLLGKELFGINSIDGTIEKIEEFISTLKLPQKFSDIKNIKKVTSEDIEWLVNHFVKDRGSLSGIWEKITYEKAKEIYNLIPR